MRLIKAVWASLPLVSLALTGCGGSGVAVNSPVTANDTAPTTATGGGSTGSGGTGTTVPPAPVTATASLSWLPPTDNTDGSKLTDLAGYNIYYGTESSALTQTIQVTNPAALGYVVTGLAKGTTWYFQVTSYSRAGQESGPSAITSKTT
ncbi:MAG TPA: fibronectin type III domain-containing protein [Steroidobacteraceae bacterium]